MTNVMAWAALSTMLLILGMATSIPGMLVVLGLLLISGALMAAICRKK